MSDKSTAAEKRSFLDRMLDAVERAGNKLPNPITMFLGLAVIVVLVSALCSALGVKALNPATNEWVETVNLFSPALPPWAWCWWR